MSPVLQLISVYSSNQYCQLHSAHSCSPSLPPALDIRPLLHQQVREMDIQIVKHCHYLIFDTALLLGYQITKNAWIMHKFVTGKCNVIIIQYSIQRGFFTNLSILLRTSSNPGTFSKCQMSVCIGCKEVLIGRVNDGCMIVKPETNDQRLSANGE